MDEWIDAAGKSWLDHVQDWLDIQEFIRTTPAHFYPLDVPTGMI